MEWLRKLVRPTVTWALTGMFVYGVAVGKVPWNAAEKIVFLVVTFWFVERAIEKAKNNK